MTETAPAGRTVTDPIGLIVDLVAAVESGLTPEQIRTTAIAVAGGRAKSRRLAADVAARPGVLLDGRSPAERPVADLLIALRRAGATAVSPPCCAGCGKALRAFQRYGRDWYCAACGQQPEQRVQCGRSRKVTFRDQAGRPRCKQCPDVDGRDPITVIYDLIVKLDPDAEKAAIATAVRRSTSRRSYQQRLAWALEEQPALLTGQSHLAPLRAIPRLIGLLHAAGVAGIVRPTCPRCHRVVRIDKPLDGARVCRTCIAHSRIEECARCAARREPVTRDDQGRPLCANCFIADPANLETCMKCGRRRPVSRRTPDGPLCASCPRLAVLTCFLCGCSTPCGISRTTGQPWCPACQRRHAACSVCGRSAPIVSGELANPRCADCTAPPSWSDCPTCSDPDHPHPGQCARCVINRRLAELMGPATASLPPGLQALRRDIADAKHTITARRWLTKPSITPILSDLAAGRIPLTHDALDALPASQPLAHLRQTLIAVGALPERDELMVGLEAFLADLLAAEPDSQRRTLLHHYLIWHLLRRLRIRNNGRPTSRQQSLMIRRLARGAVAFLDWLTAHELSLGTCGQDDLDRWCTDTAAAYRNEAGRLIRWAHANKLAIVEIASARWGGPAQPLQPEHRWEAARRLLHDESLKPEDRLAGLLILLYAQGATAISRLTIKHVNADEMGVRLRLGRVPIHLPEPVAGIARAVVAYRKGHATIGAINPRPGCFPGASRAGPSAPHA